jgi:hypothetical protein
MVWNWAHAVLQVTIRRKSSMEIHPTISIEVRQTLQLLYDATMLFNAELPEEKVCKGRKIINGGVGWSLFVTRSS